MTYRNVTYNLPIDMYLPPPYPLRPPTVFVRPVVGMAIKENHRHVGLDGRVYLPYLHDWRPGTHELRELVMWMSSLFGSEPPCYAKPPGAPPPVKSNTNSSHHPPPPPYGSSVASSSNASSSAIHGSNQSNSISSAEERRKALERDIEEANMAARIARDEEARERQMQQEHKQKLNLARVMAYSKVQDEMQRLFRNEKEELRLELKNQKQLEYGKERIAAILNEGEERKGQLEKGVREVDEAIEGLETWLSAVKEQQSTAAAAVENGNEEEKGTSKADRIALPADTHSAQMLALSAENAAIDDCVYFLDQALVRGSISVDVFLKEVRKLSKRQFMAKAHLIKIAQSRAAENR